MNEETIKLTVDFVNGESLTIQAVGFRKEDDVLIVTSVTKTYVLRLAEVTMYWFLTPEAKPDASKED